MLIFAKLLESSQKDLRIKSVTSHNSFEPFMIQNGCCFHHSTSRLGGNHVDGSPVARQLNRKQKCDHGMPERLNHILDSIFLLLLS